MASIDLGMVTAYAYAVAGGYTGSEQDFEDLLGNIAIDLGEIENLSVTVTTLPEGSQATASYNNGVLSLGIPKGDTGETGAEGPEGPTGPTGNGIQSIAKTGTAGNVDTYTITYTNGQTTTFTVTNGSVTSVDGQTGDVDLSNKANIDGYYEDLTAGYAEQLLSTQMVNDTEPYNFRTSGGSADIGNRAYDTIVGGSLAFNQLCDNLAYTLNVGVTVSQDASHLVSISGTTTAGFNCQFTTDATFNVYANHIYLMGNIVSNSSSGGTLRFRDTTNGINIKDISLSSTTKATICKSTNTGEGRLYVNTGNSGISFNLTIYPQLIDLTQLFGSTIADYIYTLEQGNAGAGVAWFKKLFPKSYYPYNAGELMHVQTSGHKMVGFNQWDEETANGYWTGTGSNTDANYIRNKNLVKVIPNATYYFKAPSNAGNLYTQGYDENGANGTGLSIAKNTTFTVPNGIYYLGFAFQKSSYGQTYNNDICINLHWDGERDGEYEAYSEHTYPLDSDLVLRGIPKLDSGNKLYYDGDTYEADGTVTRYYGIRAYQAGDENLADAITDKTNTVYKLNTPTTETADPFQSPQSVSNWGTEEYIDTRSIPIPVGHNTKYPPDLKAKLETSPNPPDADGDYIVRQTNGVNEYVALSTNATIQNIISRLEALEA